MNFETDNLGTAITMFPVLDLKFRDRLLFHRALEVGHISNTAVGNGCDNTKFPAACIAGIGAEVARTLGGSDEALEFLRSKIELLKAAGAPSEEVSTALIELADLELSRGMPRRAQETLREQPDNDRLDPHHRAMRYFIEAALAYLRLDDEDGSRFEVKARQYQVEGQTFDLSPYNVPERRVNSEDIERTRNAINSRIGNPNGYTSDAVLSKHFLELVELLRRGYVKEEEVKSIAEKMKETFPLFSQRTNFVQNAMRDHRNIIAAIELLALADKIAPGAMTEKEIRFFLEPRIDIKRKLAADFPNRLYQNNYAQFGSEPDYFRHIVRFSMDSTRAGYESVALVALEKMLEIALPPEKREGAGWQGQLQVDMANTFLTAYSLMAVLQIKHGAFREAQFSLTKANEIARKKILLDWQIGSDQLMQSFRQIAPSLRRIAQSRIDLLLMANTYNTPEIADSAFKGLQLANFSELSLASHAATKRRVAEALGNTNAIDRRDLLREEIRHLEGLLTSFPFNFPLRTELDSKNRELAELTGVIKASLPHAELLSGMDAVSVADVQSALSDDEAFVQLHAGANALYGVIIPHRGTPSFWKSDVTLRDLEKQIEELRQGVTLRTDHYPKFSVSLAHHLYLTLFGKVDKKLEKVRRLVIVVDGPLQSLPFAMLAITMPERVPQSANEFRQAKINWLIRRSALAHAPSARVFIQQRQSEPLASAKMRFAGIANPTFGDTQHSSSPLPDYSNIRSPRGVMDANLFSSLPPLPETEREVTTIAGMFPLGTSILFLGPNATERAVKATNFRDFTVIAFATHGLLAGEAKGAAEPGLALARPTTQSREDDGLLTASEIMGLKLNAELVILSACNTAASDGRPRADGLSGLAKAFFASGARAILVTHFSIPDEPAVAISTGLIKARREDPSIDWAQALQRAIVALLDDEKTPSHFGHPANWAAYALIGTTRAP